MQKQPLQIFHKIGVLENFAKILRKTSVLKSLFDKVKAYNFAKKGLQHMCCPVSFAKFLRILFFKEHVYTTASMLAVFLGNILMLKVPLKTITSAKNGRMTKKHK